MSSSPESLSLVARYVFPVDQPPISGGCVTIANGRIVEVTKRPSGPVRDLGDVAILPGLVNAHTHLEFSNLSTPIGTPGMRLPDWLRQVISQRENSQESAAEAVASGLAECIRCGTTAVGEIAQADWPVGCFQNQLIDATVFLECRGLSVSTAVKNHFAANQHIAKLPAERAWHPAISPHAPYTVSQQLLEALVISSFHHHVPLAFHLAESPEELELLQTAGGPLVELLKDRGVWVEEAFEPGRKPLDYLVTLSRAHRSLVVHGNYLDDEEIAYAAAHADRMTVVYCPRTHAFFRHPQHPLPKLLAAGASVALGTDSRASNPDLNLLAEMRFVARQFPQLSPKVVLRMGTLGGAAALGRADDYGSLTRGKCANLAIVPLPDIDKTRDSHEWLLSGESPTCATWYRGKQVYGEHSAGQDTAS
jgi:cytosine/adenosine deaminase-related metal-dependent hydrolase